MTDFINNVPVDRLTKQKMMCVNDIIYSDLFKKPGEFHKMVCCLNLWAHILGFNESLGSAPKMFSRTTFLLVGAKPGAFFILF